MTTTGQPPYSRLRRAGDIWFTAGILGQLDGALVQGGAEAELDQALVNLRELLAGVEVPMGDVVRLVVYLTDLADMGALNEAFTKHFDQPRPTRTTVVVSALPMEARVEIEATAHAVSA